MVKIWYDGEGGGNGGGADNGGAGGNTGNGGGNTNVTAPVFDDAFDVSSVLPDDLKGAKSLEKFSGFKGKSWVENVTRSLISAQGMIGADPNEIVRVPADTSKLSMEDRNKLMGRFGLPADAKAYELKAMQNPVEGFAPDAPLSKWFAQTAQKLGIFPDQAQALFEGYAGQINEALKLQQTEFAATDKRNVESLQKEFGKDFDAVLVDAKQGAQKLGGNEFIQRIGEMGLGTDPIFVKAMAKYGRVMREGGEGGDKDGAGGGGNYSVGQAKAEGQRLLQEAVAIMDSNPAKARELNAKAQEWFAKAAA